MQLHREGYNIAIFTAPEFRSNLIAALHYSVLLWDPHYNCYVAFSITPQDSPFLQCPHSSAPKLALVENVMRNNIQTKHKQNKDRNLER